MLLTGRDWRTLSDDRATAPRPSPEFGIADTVSRRAVHEVIDSALSAIERVYLDPDTARQISARLRARFQSGAYDQISDGHRLAAQLTNDMVSVNHDMHLFVDFIPGDTLVGAAPFPLAFFSRENHYALGKLDVFPGNIGYMDVKGFADDTAAEEAVVGALEYLKSTDAMIIDVRRNGGGAPKSVNFLISHFTGWDTVATLRVSSRSSTITAYTMATVPGPRRPDVPLFILTSRATESAAEAFTFVLQNLRRATIVGDRTAGAGHMTKLVPLGHGFFASISNRRITDPKTGREWERVGVKPDVQVDAARTLDMAQLLALRTLEANASGENRAHLDFLRLADEAIVSPHTVASAKLLAFAGEYDDDRHVRVADGRLVYAHLPSILSDTLIALSDSDFVTSDRARLTFRRDAHGAIEIFVVVSSGESLVVRQKSAKIQH